MKRIVIATDGSDAAADALEAGFDLASGLDAELTVLYVRPTPSSLIGDPHYQRFVTEEVQHARAVITDAKLRAARYDVDPEYEVVEGDPATSVLEFAEARDADLIVVGSRGLGRVKRTVLGSVSREIVQRADRPVLVAKTGAGVLATR